jgi:hypothetical protein
MCGQYRRVGIGAPLARSMAASVAASTPASASHAIVVASGCDQRRLRAEFGAHVRERHTLLHRQRLYRAPVNSITS